MADQEQPDWLTLPFDLLEPIAQRSRDAVTGLTAFRSVCRTWRSAVAPAPRLLLPAPQGSAGSEPHALVFPLSHGWSIVMDARDASCHLSHLATGATAALPHLNAVRDGRAASDDITRHDYEHYTDEESARRYQQGLPLAKIMIDCPSYGMFFRTYLQFSERFRFAVHVPPGTPAASTATDGMVIMMYHVLQGRADMVFCRPGDAAWTKIAKPIPPYCFTVAGFGDFAYFDGKIFGLENHGGTAVFDATTLEYLHSVDVPHGAFKCSKVFGSIAVCAALGCNEYEYLSLVALPSKLLLVSASVRSSEAKGFSIFELASVSAEHEDGLAWRKTTGDGIGGNYEFFLDGYHATFSERGAGSGTRIYYVLGLCQDLDLPDARVAAYCYDMQNNKLECMYKSPQDGCIYSTKPSWFVP